MWLHVSFQSLLQSPSIILNNFCTFTVRLLQVLNIPSEGHLSCDAVFVIFQSFYTYSFRKKKDFLSEMDIVKLSTSEPCSFEPVGSVTNVFFDDRSQQVIECPIVHILYTYCEENQLNNQSKITNVHDNFIGIQRSFWRCNRNFSA